MQQRILHECTTKRHLVNGTGRGGGGQSITLNGFSPWWMTSVCAFRCWAVQNRLSQSDSSHTKGRSDFGRWERTCACKWVSRRYNLLHVVQTNGRFCRFFFSGLTMRIYMWGAYVASVRPLVFFQTRRLGVGFFAAFKGAFINPF
jgi:hypothetical protein